MKLIRKRYYTEKDVTRLPDEMVGDFVLRLNKQMLHNREAFAHNNECTNNYLLIFYCLSVVLLLLNIFFK